MEDKELQRKDIPIDQIKVVDRIRKNALSNITDLMNDISENGLLQPIVVTSDYRLIAGERRLEALKGLGHKTALCVIKDVDDIEHLLKMEISENELREPFTMTERLDFARRLERIERAKTKERQSTLNNSLVNNCTQADEKGRTREKVAEQSGFGSFGTYNRAKYIEENKDLVPEEDFRDWDEGKLSTNKVFQRIKAEKEEAERKVRELESREPEVIEKVVEHVPAEVLRTLQDKGKEVTRLKNKNASLEMSKNAAEGTARVLQKDYDRLKDRVEQEKSKVKALEDKLSESASPEAHAKYEAEMFTAATNNYISRYGGRLWVFDNRELIPDKTWKELEKAIDTLTALAQQLQVNLSNMKQLK
jgi:ParB family chromosome partitioning protein